MMTHHSNDDSSLCYDIIITHQNSRTDVFRDVIPVIINQCDPRRPKGASGGHKVSVSRAVQASEARLYLLSGVYCICNTVSDLYENRPPTMNLITSSSSC